MRKFLTIACIYGFFGIAFGAFGAHGIKGKIDPERYANYRVGIEYLFFHLVPLIFLSTQHISKRLNIAGWFFTIGILLFTGSNLLMTTQELHHINFKFIWPTTPIGGVLMMLGWALLIIHSLNHSEK
jgi:uncharacterized membrane protein YgdD (TMEM256/DUF423 family)